MAASYSAERRRRRNRPHDCRRRDNVRVRVKRAMSQGPQGPQGPQGAQGAANTAIDDQRVMGFSYARRYTSTTFTWGAMMPDGGGPGRTVDFSPFGSDVFMRQVAMALGETYTLVRMDVALVENSTTHPISVTLLQATNASDATFGTTGAVVFFSTGVAPDKLSYETPVTILADARLVLRVIIGGTGTSGDRITINGSLVLRRTTPPPP